MLVTVMLYSSSVNISLILESSFSMTFQTSPSIFEEDFIEAMTDDIAIMLLPSVLYRSGQLIDRELLTKEAHKKGIIVGWDLCHSIGAIPHDFKKINPDFAVWCNYKYLNGGPGALAGLFINRKHFAKESGLPGWHGNVKETQFQLNHKFEKQIMPEDGSLELNQC